MDISSTAALNEISSNLLGHYRGIAAIADSSVGFVDADKLRQESVKPG